MPNTAKYTIPYSAGSDAAASIDTTMQALAERVDFLLGEGGSESITPSAIDTTTTKRVNYSRTYAPAVPRVLVTVNENRTTAQVVNVWTSGEDATGFTLNIRASSTGARVCRWEARP